MRHEWHSGGEDMITAYFDDSGTHTGGRFGPSRIVVVAGIVGTEGRLRGLDQMWKRHLDRPLCGQKDRLTRFHMVDCQESRGEFTGWTRTETDYFCHQLREVIIDSEVAGYGIAVVPRDWDELVTGDVRGFLGDAEVFCISQCFGCTWRWAQQNCFDPLIKFALDNRTPEVRRRGKTIGHTFQCQDKTPRIVDTVFLNSTIVRPLQVADMLAWEVYRHAHNIQINEGDITIPFHTSLRHLEENMTLKLQIAQRRSIEKIVAHVKNDDLNVLKEAAVHFNVFDPENPDFSHLSGK